MRDVAVESQRALYRGHFNDIPSEANFRIISIPVNRMLELGSGQLKHKAESNRNRYKGGSMASSKAQVQYYF